MLDYERETCEDLQTDLRLFGCDMDLESIRRFWAYYSDLCHAGWLHYNLHDMEMLLKAVRTAVNTKELEEAR